MRYNAAYTGEKYRQIARAMGADVVHATLEPAREAAIQAVEALNRDVGIPASLKEVGVREEDIAELAQAAFDDVCTGGNPREAKIEEIEALYRAAM